MAKNLPKILLINFDRSTANNVQKLIGVEVVRGYIENHDHYALSGVTGKQELYFKYSTPTPPYECVMVFINLDNYDAAKKEFEATTREWTETDTDNLWRYWASNRNLVVFFTGETSVRSMQPFGVMAALQKSSGVDRESVIMLDDDHEHHVLFASINEQIKMPTEKYVNLLDDDNYYGLGTRVHTFIVNKNGDPLAVGFSKRNDDYGGDSIGVLIIPQVSQQGTVISKIVKHFADHYGVQLADDGWKESDDLYPRNEIGRLMVEIQTIIDTAQRELQTRKEQIAGIKADYGYLKDLLTQQGDVLVDAVFKALTDVLHLKVTKSDEKNGSNPKEDLLVEHGGNILVEVKGTNRQNAPLKYPQQAMQHAIRQGLAGISATGLVLNHDKESDPAVRSLPYSDKESKELIADVHFIDTRVLHAIVVDVIDGKLKSEQAIELLFGKLGRAEYESNNKP